MLVRVVSTLRRITHGLLASDSPSQLAAGFTLGMIIGLVPKSNLIAVSLCVLLFSLRVNKGLAVIAALVFTVVGSCADPFVHELGLIVLKFDALQVSYSSVYNLPLGPWLGFHNTVVTGSLILGAYLAYPVYWLVRTICIAFGPATRSWTWRYRATHSLSSTTNEPLSRAMP